jgi:ribosome-associated heat shock protein Hsp15|tara:strand:- start:199 stop:588 length:390 start_codon:yes stop_codon:yes gene_type:complete
METNRIDKWLWYTRFFKSRSLATKFCNSGKIRINGIIIKKGHCSIRVGDVLTFPKGPYIRVISVLALSDRRGPAPEAKALFEDLNPPQPTIKLNRPLRPANREPGSGRPTKRDRRKTESFTNKGKLGSP